MVRLGMKCKDVVTGFTGILVARTEWMNGCVRLTLQPPVNEKGEHQEQQTFDADQVAVLDETPVVLPRGGVPATYVGEREAPAALPRHGNPGGDRPDVARRADPR